ncbi:Tubulin polyglutamylase complex subunit 2, partial [Rhizoclosmatium hyalinum]
MAQPPNHQTTLHSRKSTFIDAMLGGAVAYLESCPGVCKVNIGTTRSPVPPHALKHWESAASKNTFLETKAAVSITLPEDLRNLYEVSDGFSLQWSARFGDPQKTSKSSNNEEAQDSAVLGSLHVNGIDSLAYVAGSASKANTPENLAAINARHSISDEVLDLTRFPNPPGPAFILHESNGYGKVCLVYPITPSSLTPTTKDANDPQRHELNIKHPEIWFQSAQTSMWFFLTHSFTAYFRLAVIHLGIRGWHILFTDQGVPQEVLDWLNFYTPTHAKLMRELRAASLYGEKLSEADVTGTTAATAAAATAAERPNLEFPKLYQHLRPTITVKNTTGDSEFDLDKVLQIMKNRKDKEAATRAVTSTTSNIPSDK